MSIGRHDEPTLNALSPRNVAGWLRMRGFEYQSNYGQYGAIFVREVDGEDCEVILPTSSQVRDFGRRMTELINDLADAEDRSPNDILTDLTLAPFDVIHVPVTRRGRLWVRSLVGQTPNGKGRRHRQARANR